jgi:hypothetical protein
VLLKGVITRIEWSNPHIHGTTLSFERLSLKPPADHSKNQHSACAKSIMLPDGSRFTFVVGI